MIIIESIPQCILDHGINQCTVVHSVTVTSLHHSVRSHGHVLHTACNNDVCITCLNHLCRHVDTIQTGTAHYVDGNCRNLIGNPCFNGGLTSHVLTLSCLDDTTHIYLINFLRRNPCSVQRLFDYDCSKLCSRSRA